jgi:hypothetical protein
MARGGWTLVSIHGGLGHLCEGRDGEEILGHPTVYIHAAMLRGRFAGCGVLAGCDEDYRPICLFNPQHGECVETLLRREIHKTHSMRDGIAAAMELQELRAEWRMCCKPESTVEFSESGQSRREGITIVTAVWDSYFL